MHGVVREVQENDCIIVSSYKDNQLHGLSFEWRKGTIQNYAAYIRENGKLKCFLSWDDGWVEYNDVNKEIFIKFFTVNDFKQ